MLKYILLLICVVTLNSKTLNHIKWYWNYEKALKIARIEHKPLMLFLQKKDSKESKKMLFNTLCHKSYIKQINKNFISVVAFFEDKNSYPIEMFYTLDFPVVFFIDYKDESLLYEPIIGYIGSKQFETILQRIKLK